MTTLRNIRCLECGGKRRVFVGLPHEEEFTDIYEWCQSCKGTGTIAAQFEADGTLYWPRTIDELLAGRRIETDERAGEVCSVSEVQRRQE